jgi:type IX secretion system PorP/SprF family membrane protein
MRKIIFLFSLTLMSSYAVGQYVPNNGQAFQFAPITNPSFSGLENFTDIKMSYRYQWSGFGAYSPKFINLSLNTRLKHPVDLKQNAMRVSNPTQALSANMPGRKKTIVGLGVNVFQSKVGAINSIGGGVNFAWNYPVSKAFRLSVGLASLVESRQIRLQDIDFAQPDPFYEHLLQSASSQVDLSLRGGVLLYSSGFYLGASYLSIVNQSIQSSEVALEQPFYRGSIQTGFVFKASPMVTFKPSVLAFLLIDDSFSIDYSVKAYLQDRGWLGLTYRDSKNGVLMFGLNVTDFLDASYSYEVGFGGFQQFGEGSHELVLGFRLNNFKKATTYIW